MANEKILQQVHNCIRTQHLSLRTEEAYCTWIKRFMDFHAFEDVQTMREPHIEQYLISLAVDEQVSASTQNHTFQPAKYIKFA